MPTYPLNLPNYNFSSYSLTLERTTQLGASEFDKSHQVYRHQGTAWKFSAQCPPQRRETAVQWINFFNQLDGQVGTFLAGDAAYLAEGPLGAWTVGSSPGIIETKNIVNARATTMILKGFAPSVTKAVAGGDYFQIGSGSSARLYQILADANSNGAGEVTIEFTPPLRSQAAADTLIVHNNPVGAFRLASPDSSWSVGADRVYSIGFEAMEVIP